MNMTKKPFSPMRKNFTSNTFRRRWRRKEKKKQPPKPEKILKCAVCCVEHVVSKTTDHNSTELHKELLAVKHHWLSEGRFHKTLDEQIEKKGNDMPFVGLQHIAQYKPNEKDEHTYECRLCNGVYRPRAIFYHVLSIQHRILYLGRQHKSMGIDKKFQVNSQEQYMHLMTCIANAFQIEGKKEIKIVDRVYVPKVVPEPSVQPKQKKARKKKPKTGPTGIGMDVIKNALTRHNRDTDRSICAGFGRNVFDRNPDERKPADRKPAERKSADKKPAERKPAERKLAERKPVERKPIEREPVERNSQPPSTPSKKEEDLLELLSAFLESRSQMEDGDSEMQLDDGRPAMMQENPMVNRGPMSHEGAAFRQAGINAPGAPTQNTMMGLAARPRMPQTAKPVAGQPILPKHSTVLRRPASTTPFPTDDQGRSSLELKIAHEANMREMGISEDLISGSVGVKDPGDSNFFWCNEELYDFLGHLPVENKEDVDNVLKATELFANALVRHKQRTDQIKKRIEMEKKKLEIEKKMFLKSTGVKPTLQKKTQKAQAKSKSPSPPAGGAASKRKAPATTRSKTPPRLPDTENKQAEARPGNLPTFGNKPQGNASANPNPSQQRMQGSQFNQPGPLARQRPGLGFVGPSTDNTNPSQQRMPGSQFGQSGPSSDQGPAFGQPSNRSQVFYTGPSTANSNPSQQRMPGSQFSQSGPSSGPRMGFGQTSNRPQGNDQGLGIRQPISGSMPAFNQPRQPMHEQKPVSDPSRTQMNETRASWNEQRQPIDQSWPFTTGSRNPALEGFRSTAQGAEFSEKQLHQMNRPKPPMNERELQIESRSMREISDSEPSGMSWQQQRQNTNQERPSFNEQRLSSNDSRLPFNESRPSYGASDTYTESSAYYKGNERETGSQYANSGSTAGARTSYGAGAGRPEESDAYYTENESFASSQYSNTGSTGGAKPSYGVGAARQGESDAYEKYTGSQYGNTGSAGVAKSSYGPGAGRPGESDSYYTENERFNNAQYGNSGSTGGARPSYGAGAGRSESDAYYKENERFADSQYGATGGAKSSCGTGAGGIEGSKDNFGFNSGYTVSCPAKYYLNSSTGELQNSQRPDSMGSSYGMNQGNWSSSVPARSDNFPSKGPGAGNVQQQPYSSNQIYII